VSISLWKLLQAYSLRQHVSQSTHNCGHTLDLVLTAKEYALQKLSVSDPGLSDHCCVDFHLPFRTPKQIVQETVQTRRWSEFDVNAFEAELAESELVQTDSNDTEYLCNLYRQTLTDLLDKHAPRRTVIRRKRPHAQWFDAECCRAKREVRRHEAVHRRVKSAYCRDIWRSAAAKYRQLLNIKQQQYWSRRIHEAGSDSRKLWKSLSDCTRTDSTPQTDISATQFADYFRDKVELIRSSSAGAAVPVISQQCQQQSLTAYSPVNVSDVLRTLGQSPNKQCALDPIPTWLVKALKLTMPGILVKLVNSSIATGIFPSSEKHAIVTPVIKKAGSDITQLSNYRPISNLSFISKFIERTIASQLTFYLEANSLLPKAQSAYRRRHSTETALLRIRNDALIAADKGMVTIVVLLDYSAAFDTVDHQVMLHVLETKYGISGSALEWHRSYLCGRSCSVSYGGTTAAETDLHCSLPQGSSLGPLKFIMYAAQLHDIVHQHGVQLHSFADDSQLVRHTYVRDIAVAKQDMVQCIADIEAVSSSFRLKLNADKSEVIWLGTRQQLSKISTPERDLQLPGGVLCSTSSVKNLGVYLDTNMTQECHAVKCASSCYYQLRRIRQMRRFVDDNALRTLVHSLVTSRLDYCNSLLAGCSVKVIARLQRVQNNAARLICNQPHGSHSAPLLRQLHWLPIASRIQYKLCILMYDVYHGTAPSYLRELCHVCNDDRLRSTQHGNFSVVRTRTKLADGAFTVAGPAAWNVLPSDLRNSASRTVFLSNLKTHLYNRHFNGIMDF